uniref:Uncharacterized protein n=1 Tax=Anguilla anguilla TaxID=7936 RepID=A0A0E9T404_ANGAN
MQFSISPEINLFFVTLIHFQTPEPLFTVVNAPQQPKTNKYPLNCSG